MTKTEFIFWLKGFMDGTNKHQPTPKQWEQIREKLDEVETDEPAIFRDINPSPNPFTAPIEPYKNPYVSPSTDPQYHPLYGKFGPVMSGMGAPIPCDTETHDGVTCGIDDSLDLSHSIGVNTITFETATTDTTTGYPEGTQFSYTTKEEEK